MGLHLELQLQLTGFLARAMEIPAKGTLGLFSVSLGSVPRSLGILCSFHFEFLAYRASPMNIYFLSTLIMPQLDYFAGQSFLWPSSLLSFH